MQLAWSLVPFCPGEQNARLAAEKSRQLDPLRIAIVKAAAMMNLFTVSP
jgi:hypothetical protein